MRVTIDSDDENRKTLHQMAEEVNATADKRWREGVKRQMARFEEMGKGMVVAQVKGTQVLSGDQGSSRARERNELGGE